MMNLRIRPVFNYIAAGAILLGSALPAGAQSAAAPQQTQQIFVEANPDARQTREDLKELLNRYPPSLGRVLKLDPSLMTNDAYIASYPQLAAFFKQHPEVARNSGFFLEFVSINQGDYRQQSDAVRLWENTIEGMTVFAVIGLIVSGIIWLVKTVIDQRRWTRQSKVQTEVHTKLFDRLSSNEDLLAYIQTPAGRRFLEAAPLPLHAPQQSARPVGVPISRILWSVQIGIVILAGALGVLIVSGRERVIEEVAQPLFAIATIGICLGIGFMVSSAASYVLSKNMGLIDPNPPAGSVGPEPRI
jgi:hypothetical protein